MKAARYARWIGLAGGVFALASAIPAHAQFGSGIVFDPTASTHAITSIANESKGLANQAEQIALHGQTNLTLAQQLTQDIQMAGTALKIYNQTVQQYQTIFNNLKYFNSKTIWRSVESALMQASVQNQYGETSGLQAQMNGQSQTGSTVWKVMNLAVAATSPSFFGNEIVGTSSRLSTLAHIEAMDAASAQCLDAVSQYKAARTNNLSAGTQLDDSIFDSSVSTNSEVEQLNLLSMSDAQRMQEAHAQGQLHACMAAQAAVNNMDTRNIASTNINDANYIQAYQKTNPNFVGNESITWTGYY
jgi:hypothetical protein